MDYADNLESVAGLMAWVHAYGLGFVVVLILGALLGAAMYIAWIEWKNNL